MERKHINPYKLFYGAFIPNWLLQRAEVSAGGKLCYARLCQYAGSRGSCYPKHDDIAKEIGVSRFSIVRHIKELIDFNLIEIKREQHNNSYFFYGTNGWISKNPDVSNPHIKMCQKRTSLYIRN